MPKKFVEKCWNVYLGLARLQPGGEQYLVGGGYLVSERFPRHTHAHVTLRLRRVLLSAQEL